MVPQQYIADADAPPPQAAVSVEPDPLLVADAERRLLFMNSQALEAFGYRADEVAGLPAEEVLTGFPAPRDLPQSFDSATLKLQARRKDGTVFPVHATFGSAKAEDGKLICVSTVRDLSEQQRTEDELRRMRDQLAEAQRLARIGSWEWDIPNNVVTWSDELFRIYGMEPGEITPSYEGFLERVHPDDRASVDQRNEKAFTDHEPFDDVKRCLRVDGTVFLMRTQGEVIADEEGNPLRMLGVCEDITVEKEAERAQAELASIVESSGEAIIGRTLDGEITSWSPGAEKLYGYKADEAIGRSSAIVIPPDLIKEDRDRVAQIGRREWVDHYETRRIRKDGKLIDVSLGMSPVRDPDGELVGISVLARDITERKRFEAQLQRLADHDPLTGLINRRRFEEELAHRVAYAQRYQAGGAVLMLDLDNFKYVNDALGHSAGDELLRGVGRLLKMRLRETDLLARLGGDEFAILLPEVDEPTARTVATALLEALRDHVLPIEDRPISVTASIGIAIIGETATSGAELLADADRAMYSAKDSGRDRTIVVGTRERHARGAARLGWEHRIRTALERELFVLYQQPIMDLTTGVVSRHELLLRMRGDDGEMIPPGAFLGVAERLGLIHAVDRWVVKQAIHLLAARPELRLEVNLSGHSLDDELMLDLIRDELNEYAADPSHLVFEITETAAIGNTEVAHNFATALQSLGCEFALDDFGAGFGSFYYLKHLPADYLKIDGDFVSSPRSRTDELVIESIVRIAQGLGKRTIAEYVEDEQTLGALRELGVDFAQGFHIGRPAPLDELRMG